MEKLTDEQERFVAAGIMLATSVLAIKPEMQLMSGSQQFTLLIACMDDKLQKNAFLKIPRDIDGVLREARELFADFQVRMMKRRGLSPDS